MLKIYGLHTPMFFKVLWAAEELGINYEHVPVDLIKGETRTPQHMARHPFGKVPAIEHEGRTLFESNAILRYMGNFSKSSLYPTDAFARATVDQWIDYFSMQVGRWTTNYWYEKVIAPQYFNQPADQKNLDQFQEWLDQQMPILDTLMANSTYLCGNEMTLADINAFTLMCGWKDAGLDMTKYSNFMKWADLMKSRPVLKKIAQFAPTGF